MREVCQRRAEKHHVTAHVPALIATGFTYFPFSKAATSDIRTPAAGKKMKIAAAFYYCTTDIVTELRFKASGNIIIALPTLGSIGFDITAADCPIGAVNEVVEIYLSGAGTVKGWIIYKDV